MTIFLPQLTYFLGTTVKILETQELTPESFDFLIDSRGYRFRGSIN
jgi:hypothetical protein